MADDVARLVAVLEANIKGFTKGMEQAQKVADQRFGAIEKRLRQTESRFANSFRGLRNFAIGAGTLVGINRFVSSITNLASNLQDTSEALGVSSEALQTWGVLAGRAGVGQEQFNKAIGQFSQRLGEAQLKGGPFAKFLQGLGVGTEGNTEQVFNRLADAVKNTASAQQRAAIVAEAFGARQVRLTSFVAEGSDAIQRQREEFKKLGLIMSDEVSRKIDKLGDDWAEIKRQFQVAAAPAVAEFAEEVSKPEFQAAIRNFATAM